MFAIFRHQNKIMSKRNLSYKKISRKIQLPLVETPLEAQAEGSEECRSFSLNNHAGGLH